MSTPSEEEARQPIRIHPAPSIPNPLMTNPWGELSDDEIEREIFAASVRIDGAEHTKRSLERERARRESREGTDNT